MKKSLLVKLHIYAGLFTCFYLIAFGFSTILLNHRIDLEKSDVAKEWKTQVILDQSLESTELAETLRDSLGLMGWVLPWESIRDTATFACSITHPGKKYRIYTDFGTNKVRIAEMPKGFWHVLHQLHFFNGKTPNAPFFLRTWAIYQWTTLFVLMISLVLGYWIWIRFHFKTWEGFLFGGILFFTIVTMLLL